MAKYLGNAFSAGMLDLANGIAHLQFMPLDLLGAQDWVYQNNPVSCVGHEDTAVLISSLLETQVSMNRVSTNLQSGDEILVAQYNGPRLHEGAVSLPEGAKIRWILVSVE